MGSVDAHPSRYAASVRVQFDKQEYIQDMSSMVKELLIKFYQITHFKPVRIILYRNIISENSLDRVRIHSIYFLRNFIRLYKKVSRKSSLDSSPTVDSLNIFLYFCSLLEVFGSYFRIRTPQ